MIAVRNDKTVYKDGGRCIKVFDAQYKKADVLSEALNQARAAEAGLPVPLVRAVSFEDGKLCIVSDYIKGETLWEKLQSASTTQTEALRLLASLQRTVHEKTCPAMETLQAKLSHALAAAPFEENIRGQLLSRLSCMPGGTSLLHGEFTPDNIILTRSGSAYLLDWAHAVQGAAYADAASTYLWLWYRMGLDAARSYLSLYQQAGDLDDAVLSMWVPLVAAARSSYGMQKERAFMRSVVLSENHFSKTSF